MNTGLGEPLNSMKIRGMKIVLTLDKDHFPDNEANTKTIYSASLPDYLHLEVSLNRLPAWQGNTATAIIYGMTKEDCEAATKFNPINMQFYNQIQIYAGYLTDLEKNVDDTYEKDVVTEAIDNLPLIYLGQLVYSGPDYNNVNRPFIIQSVFMAQALVTMSNSTSINSQVKLSTIINGMINDYNSTNPQIQFELNEVYPDQPINNAHYIGSFAHQLQEICNDYGYQIRITFPDNSISTDRQIITLTKIGTAPPNSAVQDLSSNTGMIGSPIVISFGIRVVEFFNPSRSINDLINVDTYFNAIAGEYYVWQIQSILHTHGESWLSALTLYGFNNSAYA